MNPIVARLLPDRVRSVLRFVAHPERYPFFGPTPTYCKDGLATIHNADFTRDPAFARAYGASKAAGRWTGSWGTGDPEWRMFVACWAAQHACSLEGDFVECGVYRGGLASTVMEYVGFRRLTNRVFWLLDTFEGVPPEQFAASDVHRHDYPDTYRDVVALFRDYPNVRIVRGRVPATLAEVSSTRIAFLSIDMNAAVPEISAADAFWDRLAPGAVMLLDDYGFDGHRSQKDAFDQFAARRGTRVLPLPTGQGLILR
jgi:hypothetical protein